MAKKNNNYGTKKSNGITIPNDVSKELIEYKMCKAMADDIVQGTKNKGEIQRMLCDYVNDQFGLKGYCIKVHVDAK